MIAERDNEMETLNGPVDDQGLSADDDFMQKSQCVIDNSQRPRCLLTSVQCWLLFHIDMIITLLDIVFIVLVTTFREQFSSSYMGIGLNSVLGLAVQ
ncbi:hypothetical protein NW757_014554 [Fusarium falciforme]|nr:hypothetical protein NW757_014554 [Fusarium falciforme]